mmetsp:Transcript_11034/g.31436  ORF Transcript_11034/g.31436 Transcript_11034/m.31436 type:complete len:194 (+) Transcript_11034:81-662(+)
MSCISLQRAAKHSDMSGAPFTDTAPWPRVSIEGGVAPQFPFCRSALSRAAAHDGQVDSHQRRRGGWVASLCWSDAALAHASGVLRASRENSEDSEQTSSEGGNSEDEGGSCCPICFEQLMRDAMRTECGHCFHHKCVQIWAARGGTCPICRGELHMSMLGYLRRRRLRLSSLTWPQLMQLLLGERNEDEHSSV